MNPEPRTLNPSLLVFADDWGRHPSSCQHLVRHLLHRHTVCWVNTIGTRRPRLDRATLSRGLVKLKDWTAKGNHRESAPANPRVLNPRMWPWFGSASGRRLNRELLCLQLRKPLRTLPKPVVGVTTLPITADLVGRIPVQRWIYYCVDDFTVWPGLDQKPIREMERELVRRVDVVVAVSETLREKMNRLGAESKLLTHGIDLDHWQGNGDTAAIPQLERLERPLIVFWGVIDRRMDVQFLQQLAADLTRGTIVLVGPESDPDPALYSIPCVVRLSSLAYEKLPCLASHASVLIMPYADLPVTRAMQPLKLKEYLATGKPTVARNLPSVKPWVDCLDSVDTPQEFSRAVRLRLTDDVPERQRLARSRLASESWVRKAAAFERWIVENESGSSSSKKQELPAPCSLGKH